MNKDIINVAFMYSIIVWFQHASLQVQSRSGDIPMGTPITITAGLPGGFWGGGGGGGGGDRVHWGEGAISVVQKAHYLLEIYWVIFGGGGGE